MKSIFKLFIITMMIFLTACTAAVTNPPDSSPSASPSPLPALNTIEPTTAKTPTPEQNDSNETPMVTADSSMSSGVTDPAGEVDLSQITSEPPDNSTPAVMPKPGVPDLEAAIGHTVSQDLARRLDIDISEVTVLNVEAQEWRDSSLGCPAPGMNYLTVMTPGFLVSLEASGSTFTYHTDRAGNFVLCGENGQPVFE